MVDRPAQTPARLAIRSRRAAPAGSAATTTVIAIALIAAAGLILVSGVNTVQEISRSPEPAAVPKSAAESAVERALEDLRAWSEDCACSALDELLARAAGPNGVIDLDPGALRITLDPLDGRPRVEGAGDDEPLRRPTGRNGGAYAAFLSNDPLDGSDVLRDANGRVTVTAVAVTSDSVLEIIEADVRRRPAFPPLPAAITLLGPDPYFHGGKGAARLLSGNDCGRPWWLPGESVPVVGVLGPAAEIFADSGVVRPDSFRQGSTERGADSVDDVTASIDAGWTSCRALERIGRRVRDVADLLGTSETPNAELERAKKPAIAFIDGDYQLDAGFEGEGLLWVTGKLTISGAASWRGAIFAIGRGEVQRTGRGRGRLSGAFLAANTSGPDGETGTEDDCSTEPDGFGPAVWNVGKRADGDTIYCSTDVGAVLTRWPFETIEIRRN